MIKCVFIPWDYDGQSWDAFFEDAADDIRNGTHESPTFYIEAELPAVPRANDVVSFCNIDVYAQLQPQLQHSTHLQHLMQWWIETNAKYYPEMKTQEDALRHFCSGRGVGFNDGLWFAKDVDFIAGDEHVYIYISH